MKKVGGRKWEKFLPDAFEFRKNERECDEHVGAEGSCVKIEAESNCATAKEATIYSGRRKPPLPARASRVEVMHGDGPKGIPREYGRG